MGLREFLDRLKKEGSLQEINRPISPIFEAPHYVYQDKRPVLFHDCNGMRAAMNVLNSRETLAKALGVTPDNIINKLTNTNFNGQIKHVDKSPMFEAKSKACLSRLPIMKHFKKDGGSYITAGIVVSKYKDMYNASIHRLMVVNDNTLAARLVPPRHTYVMHKEAASKNEPLQVGIVIGVDPVTVFAASTRVPQGKEWEYAASLKGEPIELVKLDNGVEVPHGEIVLEGSIDPSEKVKEGPFVDITGSYDHIRPEPVIHLTNMMMRKDPIYHGILPGGNEHKLLMGVPFYGKSFDCGGLGQPFTTCTDYSYTDAMALRDAGWTWNWDATSRVPWLRRSDGGMIVCYDDTESVGAKCDYVRTKQAAGLIIWELTEDYRNGTSGLLEVVGRSFRTR